MKKLTVIIVNYNVCHFLLQCIDSLDKALKDIEAEIVVVDNHSRDNSVAALHKHYPHVRVVENLHNVGFSKANNIAIRQTTGEYVLLLNPDTIVAENAINDVIDFLDAHPDSGALGVMMLNADGTLAPESRRGVPSPLISFYKLSGLCDMFPHNRRLGRYYLGYLPWDSPQKIEIVSGAFCMLRRSALDNVGLLDENFFMYGEDIDLSYRLLLGGYVNWYFPTQILHYKGESTHKSSFRYVHVFYNAMLIFFRKHYSHLGMLITLPIKMAIWVKALLALVTMVTTRMRRSLGFAVVRNIAMTGDFVFIGLKTMTDACRDISRKHGLNAIYLDKADPIYINKVLEKTKNKTTLVFDPQSISYREMLSVMRQMKNKKVNIGTYQYLTGSIITHSEIIQ